MGERKKIIEKEVAQVRVDWAAIDEWRKPGSDSIPACSFMHIYEACGLKPYFEEYHAKTGKALVALDNLSCNFPTLQALKRRIEETWETYSIDIDADSHVFWKNDKFGKKKHYPKTMSGKVKASVLSDMCNFCPGIDDDLPDDVISFKTYEYANIVEDATNEQN